MHCSRFMCKTFFISHCTLSLKKLITERFTVFKLFCELISQNLCWLICSCIIKLYYFNNFSVEASDFLGLLGTYFLSFVWCCWFILQSFKTNYCSLQSKRTALLLHLINTILSVHILLKPLHYVSSSFFFTEITIVAYYCSSLMLQYTQRLQ